MTHGSLFSGIGGFDLAAEWMGWENVFHCEMNDFLRPVLNYYWPNAISYEDITKTDFTIHRGRIDILTGGFPCQPYSAAGKRLGTADDRHLWPEMLRAIREIQPKWVVGENVFGLVNWNGGLVFDQVQADLEDEGYEVQPYILPACAVNAPHRRDRIWFVAYRNSSGLQKEGAEQQTAGFEQYRELVGNAADTSSLGRNNGSDNREERCIPENKGITTENKSEWNGWECGAGSSGAVTSDANNAGSQGREFNGAFDKRVRPCESSESTAELHQVDNWRNFPTQSPVRSRNDGVSSELVGITVSKHRNESIKAAGNAVVPQLVLQIFKAIQQWNENYLSL